jgi:hypothetical protein
MKLRFEKVDVSIWRAWMHRFRELDIGLHIDEQLELEEATYRTV